MVTEAAAAQFCTRCGAAFDREGVCPNGHGTPRARRLPRLRIDPKQRPTVLAAAAVVLLSALLAAVLMQRADARRDASRLRTALAALDKRLEAETAASNGLSRRLGEIETKVNSQPDPAAVAKAAGASVYTVEAGEAFGSSFVIGSANGSSSLVTNYHVVEEAWESGAKLVRIRQEGKDFEAVIDRVSKANDLAVLTVASALPALAKATDQPSVGDAVLVLGAPLGLGGSVSNGIVSAFRDGYIQFSAPIAPGNSGGPLVNLRGQVIGVTRSKLVAEGAEGLSFAIPISLVCTSVSAC